MKKLAVFVLAVWSLALCDRPAMAQTQVIPNGVGGYNVYGPQGTTCPLYTSDAREQRTLGKLYCALRGTTRPRTHET